MDYNKVNFLMDGLRIKLPNFLCLQNLALKSTAHQDTELVLSSSAYSINI